MINTMRLGYFTNSRMSWLQINVIILQYIGHKRNKNSKRSVYVLCMVCYGGIKRVMRRGKKEERGTGVGPLEAKILQASNK